MAPAEKQLSVAVIISSHLLHLLEEVCSHVLILKRGKKIAHGTLETTQARWAAQAELSNRVSVKRKPAEASGTRMLSFAPIGRLSSVAARRVVAAMTRRRPGWKNDTPTNAASDPIRTPAMEPLA